MEQQSATSQHAEDLEELLDPDFLRKVEQLSLVAKRVFPGRLRGDRRSTKRGSSVEFADFRNYTPGDDHRRIDWNVYARLERLFLKLFVEEEDLYVYILVDASQSMSFGSPSKLLYAKRVAAALTYIALSNLDRVGLAVLSGPTATMLSPKRGKQSAPDMFDWLQNIRAERDTRLAESLREFALRTPRPGLAIVVSDFFDNDYERGLSALISRRFEVSLLHLLDQDEMNPPTVGDLLMIDSETNERREVSVTQSLLKAYGERLRAFCTGLENYSARYGCNYLRITNQSSFEDLVLNYMRRREMVK